MDVHKRPQLDADVRTAQLITLEVEVAKAVAIRTCFRKKLDETLTYVEEKEDSSACRTPTP